MTATQTEPIEGHEHEDRAVRIFVAAGSSFHVFASLTEFERDLIQERTNACLAAARSRGRTGGRVPQLSPDQVRTARQFYDKRELTVAEVGKVLGVSRTTIYRALKTQARLR